MFVRRAGLCDTHVGNEIPVHSVMVHLESGGANVAANSSGEGGSVSRRGAGASRGGSKLKLGDGSVAGQYHFVFNVCVCPLHFTPVCYQSASSNRIPTLFSTFAHFTSPQFASPCQLQRGTAAAESRASAQTLVLAYFLMKSSSALSYAVFCPSL